MTTFYKIEFLKEEEKRYNLQLKIYSISSVSTCNLKKGQNFHSTTRRFFPFYKKYYNYKAHPMHTDTRHPPPIVPCTSEHSTWQKSLPGSLQHTQASSNSTHRNSILSSRQHPHTHHKIPQAHSYRILQGEIGFFPKGLSIALSYSTKVSDFRNSLSYYFLHIELFYKKFNSNKVPMFLSTDTVHYLQSISS